MTYSNNTIICAGGSANGYGSVFRVTTNGVLTTLMTCCLAKRYSPYAGLTLGNDGHFYGTFSLGEGYYGKYGAVFRVTTNSPANSPPGEMSTILTDFDWNNGAFPQGCPSLGNDGIFYGTTSGGGITNSKYTSGMGTVFRVTTNGTLTKLMAFNSPTGQIRMLL